MLRERLEPFKLLFFGVAFWDAFTTVYGTVGILGGPSFIVIVFSVMVAALMLVLFLNTFNIWDDHDDKPMNSLVFVMWGIAVLYDVYTSFVGNRVFLTPEGMTFSSFVVVFLATALVCGSTMISSWIIYGENDYS